MLFINDIDGKRTWHVGEPLPEMRGPIVRLQADGHELNYLLAVLYTHQAQAYDIGVRGGIPI